MDINENSGIAMATGVGNSVVVYNVSEHVSSYTETRISPVTSMMTSQRQDHLSNVPSRGSGVFVGVQINGKSGLIGEY